MEAGKIISGVEIEIVCGLSGFFLPSVMPWGLPEVRHGALKDPLGSGQGSVYFTLLKSISSPAALPGAPEKHPATWIY